MSPHLLRAGLVLVLLSSGCDSGATVDVCEAIDFQASGSFSVAIDGRSDSADCLAADVSNGQIRVSAQFLVEGLTGYNVSLGTFDTSPGTYSVDLEDIGELEEGAVAAYTDAQEGFPFDAGTVTIEAISPDRVRGSFDVETDEGRTATGRFDLGPVVYE